MKGCARHQVSALLFQFFPAESDGDLEELRRHLSSSDSPLQSSRSLSGAEAVIDISLGFHSSLCHLSHSVNVSAHFMSRPKAIGQIQPLAHRRVPSRVITDQNSGLFTKPLSQALRVFRSFSGLCLIPVFECLVYLIISHRLGSCKGKVSSWMGRGQTWRGVRGFMSDPPSLIPSVNFSKCPSFTTGLQPRSEYVI